MPVSDFVSVRCYLGLDLGQVNDRSALVVIIRTVTTPPSADAVWAERLRRVVYDVPFVERWKLGTPYPDVVARTRQIVERLADRYPGVPIDLAFDRTGVGRAVGDLLRRERWPEYHDCVGSMPVVRVVPVSVTSGDQPAERHSQLYVPKRDLIAAPVVLFQSGLLRIASGVAEQDVLVNELVNFRATQAAGGLTTYANAGGVNGAANDDVVNALALAAYRAHLQLPRCQGPLF